MSVTGTFLPGGKGRILVVTHEPAVAAGPAVLVVPAFAEEMNKARRLVWETGRALAARGCRVVVPDLYGTGDSEGDFAEARWEIWIDDLRSTVEWMRGAGTTSFSALVVRLGAALFAGAEAETGAEFDRVVAWQPVQAGSSVIRHLLRMKAAGMRLAGESPAGVGTLSQELLGGTEPMELGGYLVSPELAAAIDRSRFAFRELDRVKRGLVIELESPSAAGTAASAAPDDPGDATWRVEKVAGDKFWLAVEPAPNPLLVRATAEFLCEADESTR